MKFLERLLRRQEIDAWRSEYTLMAARTLNQVAADLIVEAERELAQATWKDGLIAQGAFVNERIAPRLRKEAELVAQMIVEEANQSLRAIVDVQAVWTRSPEMQDAAPGTFEGFSDIAAAAGPLAAGVATATAVPAAAVTTTTTLLGLGATATVISWPVVLGGGALAGIGIATGVVQSARIWDKTLARLRSRVRKFIVAALVDGTPDMPSVLQQLGAEFKAIADRATRL